MGQPLAAQPCDYHFERLLEDFPRIHERDAIVRQFERRDTATHTQFESSIADVIQHTDLTDKPERVVEWQQKDQGTKMDATGALCGSGEEQSRRRCHSQRRGVMLGDVVAEEPCGVVLTQQRNPPLEEPVERVAPAFNMIENAKSYCTHRRFLS
jgi:hypothetical protein